MNGRIELTFTTVPRCAIRKFGYLQKLRYSLCNFVPNYVLINYFAAACRSRCQQSSPSRRLHRRPSLLTTPIRQLEAPSKQVNIIYKRAQWSAKPNLRRKRRGVKWIGKPAGSSGS